MHESSCYQNGFKFTFVKVMRYGCQLVDRYQRGSETVDKNKIENLNIFTFDELIFKQYFENKGSFVLTYFL